jgi:hypothetical protein
MDFYYSQKYWVYANSIIGYSNGHPLRMADSGCLITDWAMVLSYFNGKPYYPDMALTWLLRHNGLTSGGLLKFPSMTEATAGKLRYSLTPNAKPGELTYGIRQVKWDSMNHWVMDHPTIAGKVIDPWMGSVKPYLHEHKYTGRNIFYIGKQ